MIGVIALVFIIAFTGVQISRNNQYDSEILALQNMVVPTTTVVGTTTTGVVTTTPSPPTDLLIETGVCRIFDQNVVYTNQLIGYQIYTNNVRTYVVFNATDITGISSAGNVANGGSVCEDPASLAAYTTYIEFSFSKCTTDLTGNTLLYTIIDEVPLVLGSTINANSILPFVPSESAKVVIPGTTTPIYGSFFYQTYFLCYKNMFSMNFIENSNSFRFTVGLTAANGGIVNITEPIKITIMIGRVFQ